MNASGIRKDLRALPRHTLADLQAGIARVDLGRPFVVVTIDFTTPSAYDCLTSFESHRRCSIGSFGHEALNVLDLAALFSGALFVDLGL